jgi:hypothetical protein
LELQRITAVLSSAKGSAMIDEFKKRGDAP